MQSSNASNATPHPSLGILTGSIESLSPHSNQAPAGLKHELQFFLGLNQRIQHPVPKIMTVPNRKQKTHNRPREVLNPHNYNGSS